MDITSIKKIKLGFRCVRFLKNEPYVTNYVTPFKESANKVRTKTAKQMLTPFRCRSQARGHLAVMMGSHADSWFNSNNYEKVEALKVLRRSIA